jgi:hypothetical protein
LGFIKKIQVTEIIHIQGPQSRIRDIDPEALEITINRELYFAIATKLPERLFLAMPAYQ